MPHITIMEYRIELCRFFQRNCMAVMMEPILLTHTKVTDRKYSITDVFLQMHNSDEEPGNIFSYLGEVARK